MTTDTTKLAKATELLRRARDFTEQPMHDIGGSLTDEIDTFLTALRAAPAAMTDKPRVQAWCAHGVRADLKCEQCAAQEGVGSAGSGATLPEGLADAIGQSQFDELARQKSRGDNHAESLRSIARMDPKDGERMQLWARDSLSGYTETVGETMAELRDELARVRGERASQLTDVLAALVAALSIIQRAENLRKSPSHAVASDKMYRQMIVDYQSSVDRARAALAASAKGEG